MGGKPTKDSVIVYIIDTNRRNGVVGRFNYYKTKKCKAQYKVENALCYVSIGIKFVHLILARWWRDYLCCHNKKILIHGQYLHTVPVSQYHTVTTLVPM